VRFDVTVPATTGTASAQHLGITPDAVAELVEHAAAHGLRLSIRSHRPQADAPVARAAAGGPA
jgi:hypothetical protein